MGTNEIINLAKDIKNKYNGVKIIDIINNYGFELGYTSLKPNVYPAYTINFGGLTKIILNTAFTEKSQNVLAAHELGHAILHKDNCYNQFGDNRDDSKEYEANLFAVVMLFKESDLNTKFNKMSNFELKFLLDYNIEC